MVCLISCLNSLLNFVILSVSEELSLELQRKIFNAGQERLTSMTETYQLAKILRSRSE
ncbi:MAG: hypothetical protein JWR09_516 [Mucilaginibacter sp.]|nr:hypothetical protein [Mucilaginibacter sp.]